MVVQHISMTTKKRLRTGFTTGTVAAAKGALSLILTGEKAHSVQIKLTTYINDYKKKAENWFYNRPSQ